MTPHNATQQILDKIDTLNTIINDLVKRIDKVEEQQKIYHNENMNRLNQVIGELETLRDENTIGTYQINELRESHTDHEKRIINLEKRV